jgi:HK97 family phage portal protein
MAFLDFFKRPITAAAAAWDEWQCKKAFDRQRVGVNGLDPFPKFDRNKLFDWNRKSEIAYACIGKISEAAQDTDLIVQRRKSREATWEPEPGHPLRRLMMRPNPGIDGEPATTQADFFGAWLASEAICGEFFAEIERDLRTKKPIALWPLDSSKMTPLPDGAYAWRDSGEEVRLEPGDLFISRLSDPQNPLRPLAPMQVALGRIEADLMKSAFVRAFFKSSGVPSGVIKIKGRTLTDEKAQEISKRWARRFGFGGNLQGAPPVFDDNGDYQQIGSKLGELDATNLQASDEARICGAFGVPPLLISALVGLMYVNQRASAIESQREFWANKMSPTFKRMRIALQWSLLLEFEPEEQVYGELVRLNWDMSQVVALQETISERSMRAREDFRVGGLMLDEFRGILGMAALPNGQGQYYLRRANQLPISQEVVAAQMAAAADVAARQVALLISGSSSPDALAEDGEDADGKSRPRQSSKRAMLQRKDCGCKGVKAKSYDWDGVHCWREPSEAERKAGLRSFGLALQKGRESIAASFYLLRGLLIEEALRKLQAIKPGFFHELILDWPAWAAASLRESLSALFGQGQQLVKAEMMAQRDGLSGELSLRTAADDERLTRVSDVAISRVLNDVQARVASAAAQFAMAEGTAFLDAVRLRLEGQSTSFLESAASVAAVSAISAGRLREMTDGDEGLKRKDDRFGYWVYNWITLFEGNHGKGGKVCDDCLTLETMSLNCDALVPTIWPDVPNPDCAEGFGQCRCGIWKQWWTDYPPRDCY